MTVPLTWRQQQLLDIITFKTPVTSTTEFDFPMIFESKNPDAPWTIYIDADCYETMPCQHDVQFVLTNVHLQHQQDAAATPLSCVATCLDAIQIRDILLTLFNLDSKTVLSCFPCLSDIQEDDVNDH